MASKLFVGGLPFAYTDSDLENMFKEYGDVVSANIVKDRDSQRSKGFGFVEFATQEEADKAKSALNGTDLDGRNLTVDDARPRNRD